ncbi:MAG: hypothetical protein AAF495_04515 [Pseudomonadota bacterium]
MESDLDTAYAFKVFFGKSIEEAIPKIQGNPIERADEIRFMPPVPFRYYILALRDYLLSEQSRGDFDAPGCYLRLIEEKLRDEPEKILPVMQHLEDSIERVAKAQAFYDADVDIFGDFVEIRARIVTAYEARCRSR